VNLVTLYRPVGIKELELIATAGWKRFPPRLFWQPIFYPVLNLGNDTDTTGAVAGGLAGLLYGWETIPAEWLDVLARRDDIIELADRLKMKMQSL
jgi:hypothetical protein